jgi:hypothetical protein
VGFTEVATSIESGVACFSRASTSSEEVVSARLPREGELQTLAPVAHWPRPLNDAFRPKPSGGAVEPKPSGGCCRGLPGFPPCPQEQAPSVPVSCSARPGGGGSSLPDGAFGSEERPAPVLPEGRGRKGGARDSTTRGRRRLWAGARGSFTRRRCPRWASLCRRWYQPCPSSPAARLAPRFARFGVPSQDVSDSSRLPSSYENETFGWRPPAGSHSPGREDGDCNVTRL